MVVAFVPVRSPHEFHGPRFQPVGKEGSCYTFLFSGKQEFFERLLQIQPRQFGQFWGWQMSTKNHDRAKAHKAAFRQRRKNGLQAVPKPWGWLSIPEVKEMALKAYYVASHGLIEDVQAGRLTDQDLRQLFALNLADLMRDLVLAQAATRGGCWPVDAGTPRHQNYAQIAADLCAELPDTWRPQYPVYKPATEAQAVTEVQP